MGCYQGKLHQLDTLSFLRSPARRIKVDFAPRYLCLDLLGDLGLGLGNEFLQGPAIPPGTGKGVGQEPLRPPACLWVLLQCPPQEVLEVGRPATHKEGRICDALWIPHSALCITHSALRITHSSHAISPIAFITGNQSGCATLQLIVLLKVSF